MIVSYGKLKYNKALYSCLSSFRIWDPLKASRCTYGELLSVCGGILCWKALKFFPNYPNTEHFNASSTMPPNSGIWSLLSTDWKSLSTILAISLFGALDSSWWGSFVVMSFLSSALIVYGFLLCRSIISWCYLKRVLSSSRPYLLNKVSLNLVEYCLLVAPYVFYYKCKLSILLFAFSVTAFIDDFKFWVSFKVLEFSSEIKCGLFCTLIGYGSFSSVSSVEIFGHYVAICSLISAWPLFSFKNSKGGASLAYSLKKACTYKIS